MNKKEYATLCFNDKHMQDFIEKDTFDVVELSSGVFGLDKLKIQTTFCFGYGCYGVSTDEDTKRAGNLVAASKEEKYFIDQNLKSIDEKIELLKLALTNDNFFRYNNKLHSILLYERFTDTPGVVCWVAANSFDVCGSITQEAIRDAYQNNYFGKSDKNVIIATKEDLEKLFVLYLKQKENFVKRLCTWWKRYGSSHINSWSYLVD